MLPRFAYNRCVICGVKVFEHVRTASGRSSLDTKVILDAENEAIERTNLFTVLINKTKVIFQDQKITLHILLNSYDSIKVAVKFELGKKS